MRRYINHFVTETKSLLLRKQHFHWKIKVLWNVDEEVIKKFDAHPLRCHDWELCASVVCAWHVFSGCYGCCHVRKKVVCASTLLASYRWARPLWTYLHTSFSATRTVDWLTKVTLTSPGMTYRSSGVAPITAGTRPRVSPPPFRGPRERVRTHPLGDTLPRH